MPRIGFVTIFVLTACGRIDFSPVAESDAVPVGQLAIVVTTDDGTSSAPVAAAYVGVVAGGATTTYRTDPSGRVQFPLPPQATIEVGYSGGTYDRVFTIVAPPAGIELSLGGRTGSLATATMSFDVPLGNNVSNYGIKTTFRCRNVATSTTTTVAFNYPVDCEGRTVDARAYYFDTSGAAYLLDAGPLTLTANATDMVNGAYVVQPTHSLDITHLAPDVVSVHAVAATYLAADRDFADSGLGDTATPSAGAATLTLHTPPASAVRVDALAGSGSAGVFAFVPVAIGSGSASFDATNLLPLITLDRSAVSTIQWSTQGSGQPPGDLMVVDAIYTSSVPTLWTTIAAPAGRTSVSFPTDLPAELAGAVPSAPPAAAAIGIVASGATLDQLMPHADLELGILGSSLVGYTAPNMTASIAIDPPTILGTQN